MRKLLLLCWLPVGALAQPGPEPFPEPCDQGSYCVPLLHIGRNDVRVITLGMGTDDVPSSSGNCIRHVNLMEHAEFLLQKDGQGYYRVAEPEAGELLHPDSLTSGIATGRYRWGQGSLAVCYQGYGAQFDGKGWRAIEPRTWERSIVRVTTPEGNYLVEMTVALRLPEGLLYVRGRHAVPEGRTLPIH